MIDSLTAPIDPQLLSILRNNLDAKQQRIAELTKALSDCVRDHVKDDHEQDKYLAIVDGVS